MDLKSRRLGIDKAMEELNVHIKKLEEKFGSFKYSAPNVPYDPHISYGHIVKGALLKKEKDPVLKTEPKTEPPGEDKASVTRIKSEEAGVVNKTEEKTGDNGDPSVEAENAADGGCGTLIAKLETDSGESAGVVVTPMETGDLDEWRKEGKPALSIHTPSAGKSPEKRCLRSEGRTQPGASKAGSSESDNGSKVSKLESTDSKLEGLNIIERLELKLLEAAREDAEQQAKEQSAQESEEDKSSPDTLPRDTKPCDEDKIETNGESKTPDGSSNDTDIPPTKESLEGKVQGAASPDRDIEFEFKSPTKAADREEEIDVPKVSLIGTPKRNPMLDHLVDSCKAQLGIESEEDLVSNCRTST